MDLSAYNGRAQNICPGRGKGVSSFPREQMRIHLILNAYWELLDFELPHRPVADYTGGFGLYLSS
jgi:hypothetical protein